MRRVLKKVKAVLIIIYMKIIYKNNISFGKRLGLSRGINIMISNNGKVRIGNDVFFNNYCSINCLKSIDIGDGCIFGESVKIYDHNHKYINKNIRIKDQGFSVGKISIGENCWIGSNVTILKDVTIGKNVIIGANCLIYQSIPSNSIVKNNNGIVIDTIY